MKNLHSHIIQTVSVETDFMQAKQDMQLQNRMARVIKEELLPELEQLFNDKAPSYRCIKIDKLDIELGNIPAENWEKIFVEESVKKIKEKIDAISSLSADDTVYEINYLSENNTVEKHNEAYYYAEALAYFIRTGILPWHINEPLKDWFNKVDDLFKRHGLSDAIKQQLIAAIFNSTDTFTRFVIQLPESLVAVTVQMLTDIESNDYKAFSEMHFDLHVESGRNKTDVLRLLAVFAAKENIIGRQRIKDILIQTFSSQQLQKLDVFLSKSKDAAINVFAGLVKEFVIEGDKAKDDTKNKTTVDKKQNADALNEDAIFIDNAGLVILHPFLKPLFSHLHYTEKDAFVNEEMHARAVLFTQYLITGETQLPEYDLLLNKLLCGYPLQQTLSNTIELSAEEITEAEDLLQSVIKHWSALKNTGVEALRNTFLKRPGKLTETDDHWLLQTELKSFDVLMNYLPWSISIIYLPWMEKKLMVEW